MDIWYYPRSALAEKYMKTLEIGISSNLAIIAPRRKGKTLFVLNDVGTCAKEKGFIPIYASLWQNMNAPCKSILLALEETLEALEQQTPFSRLFGAKVKKTSLSNELIGKVEIEFADHPEEPTSNDLILLDRLLTKIQKKAKQKTVLLMIDEVQHLSTSDRFAPLAHALRTMLDKRSGEVKALFTGSSRHYMNLLFNESQSPFYHFVETLPFPDLGDEFITFLLAHLQKHREKSISFGAMKSAFVAVDQSPYWIMKVISHMLTFEETLSASLEYVLQLIQVAEGFDRLATLLKPIDKLVYLALCSGESPFSNKLLQKIDSETSVKGVVSNVQSALKRLMSLNLVTQMFKGEYKIEKPGFKAYLNAHISKQ